VSDKKRCACGLPLHYTSRMVREQVERMIALSGGNPMVVVTVTSKHGRPTRHFLVQRHYIALHGLKTQELLKGNIPGAEEIDIDFELGRPS
jgi:hypothetical protein